MRISQAGRARQVVLVANSPLRTADPRTKLFISLAASFVVMLPIDRLGIFIGIYAVFLLWARLFKPAIYQIWRIKWVLFFLFVLDWWLIDLHHAMLICARLILLAGIFTLFFATTTTRELNLAFEYLRIPYRYAFSLSLAFQSIGLLDDEWRAIHEAQVSRGALTEISSLRRFLAQLKNLISLTVPAIVLTTKRAWAITEAAYARGFDSPHRRSFHQLHFTRLDGILLVGTLIVIGLLVFG